MKILYIATSFPKEDKGSSIYTDLAEALVQSNHKVTVIVAEERKNTKETTWYKERGCEVLRVRVGNFYDVGFIEKAISILSMEYFLKFAIKKNFENIRFDLILYESPPVTNCGVIRYAKKKFRAKTYLMLKDIFPQNAVDIEIMKENSLSYKLFKRKEKQLYEISDFIGTMSKGNMDYILKHNKFIDKNKVGIFPNTKRISAINKYENDNEIRKKFNIPLEATLFLFGGNMGKPQGTDFLCEAINKLKHDKNIFFVLVGRGTERKNIKNFLNKNKCKNVLQIDNLPRDEYEKLVLESDVGLVLLDKRFTIPNYPSRILSYMEYSKPVLVATDKNTDFKELILNSGCGFWSYSGDLDSFCKNILTLSNDKNLRNRMGICGRRYMENNFSVDDSVELIEKFMSEVNLYV